MRFADRLGFDFDQRSYVASQLTSRIHPVQPGMIKEVDGSQLSRGKIDSTRFSLGCRSAEEAARVRYRPSAEMLSIMMTDVEGSTALRRTRGDRFVNEILGLHGAIVRDQIGACGGQERQFLGDGSFCPSRHRRPPSAAPSASSARMTSTMPPTQNARSGFA